MALEMAAYASVREELNQLYLKMLPLRRELARNTGLADYRAYRWLEFCRFDYTPEDCRTFHDAIEHEFVRWPTRSRPKRVPTWAG